ncbi:MAG: YifB family Mg chelatase-like AAA ATPase [Clostridia bacterium]|nr:YifB family Mg chelatase-like AAA ATPase [Clostridia bacterium]
MIAKTVSCALSGIDGVIVTIEADCCQGLPSVDIVGLPDTAVKESKERVRSAVNNSGFSFPQRKVVVNLAPAYIRKEGSFFDLPITIAILSSSGQLREDYTEGYIFIGELALDGSLRGVNGVLPMVIEAAKNGYTKAIVPEANAPEAAVVSDVEIYGAKTLSEAVAHLTGEAPIEQTRLNPEDLFNYADNLCGDYEDVKGQDIAKRALTVAAAGGHNVLMIGSPGSGKTMLAKRLPTIMPSLTFEESLEVTKIYSISGKLPEKAALITTRPFRDPHHTVSAVAITGGGANPKPGEICLAHKGVLFLDEFPEFRKDAIDAMRQPLEDGSFTVARANGVVTFPSDVMLVASMNPCKCGYYGDTSRECKCSAGDIQRYMHKISGPMLDRIDIHIQVPSVKYSELSVQKKTASSEDMKKAVDRARAIQAERYKDKHYSTNAGLDSKGLEEYCKLDKKSNELLTNVFENLGLSARAYTRILKVARTIADLDESENIEAKHIAEAIQYRTLDKKFWFN